MSVEDASRPGATPPGATPPGATPAGTEAVVKRSAAVPGQEVAAGRATRVQVLLGPADGTPHFAMRRFVMGEGGGMPRHTNAVEHEQYVLAGRALITVGEEAHEVSRGDVLYIPAGAPHSYRVLEAPFEFLCLVPNLPDRIDVLEPMADAPAC
jgi:quercetin dioxygenase-like cupin family protein